MQAVARGEATLDNTLAGFLGSLDPAARARTGAPPPAASGRRLKQATNYLVQAGKYGCATSKFDIFNKHHHSVEAY